MKLIRLTAMLLLALSLASCARVQVSQDYDRAFDFSTLQTYRWLPANKQVEPTAADFARREPLIHARIERAINANLAGKGYRKADQDADFYVTYHVTVKTRLRSTPSTLRTFYYGRHAGWVIYTGSDIYQYEEGTLLIDILDEHQQLVWRGAGSSIIDEYASMEQTTRLINDVVNSTLAQFPPQTGAP